ncbi:MAG: hypothetical protein Q9227_001881 [Pyrenula ochraceoflavens]
MDEEERPRKVRKLEQHESEQAPLIEAQSYLEQTQAVPRDDSICENGNGVHEDALGDENASRDSDNTSTNLQEDTEPNNGNLPNESDPAQPPLSKNQRKKLKRREEWEARRPERKQIRKQKAAEKKQRQRLNREQALAEGGQAPDGSTHGRSQTPRAVLPVTFLIDCGFDDLMIDKELISLASQITRAYSDNSHAPYQAHLMVSSFGGKLKDRFETVLSNHHRNWKGFEFENDNFVAASKLAATAMANKKYRLKEGTPNAAFSRELENLKDCSEPEGEVVYLTSESPNTLQELKPYSTYIIGGLVDKNRHKGLCYKAACDHGVKTARLPISDFMDMQSRFVLATNHVIEIMLRWLEYGDWGEAFLKVMPKRKGGSLKQRDEQSKANASSEDPKSVTTGES